MTAPDLVEIVAGVLESHQFSAFSAEGNCVCTCDAVVTGEGEGWEEYAAHQARAVLAALTEAGTVEWGIFRKDEAGNTWTPMENARFKTLAKAEGYRKNMFLPAFQEIIEPRFRHVGPWQKLEE